jgi:hypothetical protein
LGSEDGREKQQRGNDCGKLGDQRESALFKPWPCHWVSPENEVLAAPKRDSRCQSMREQGERRGVVVTIPYLPLRKNQAETVMPHFSFAVSVGHGV